jgi:hypothetical protein
MSYPWIGPPAQFNGTDDITGGDSGEYKSPCTTAHVPSATRILRDQNTNA